MAQAKEGEREEARVRAQALADAVKAELIPLRHGQAPSMSVGAARTPHTTAHGKRGQGVRACHLQQERRRDHNLREPEPRADAGDGV